MIRDYGTLVLSGLVLAVALALDTTFAAGFASAVVMLNLWLFCDKVRERLQWRRHLSSLAGVRERAGVR